MASLLNHLESELADARYTIAKPDVELILGTDREIGRETQSQEKRVGITPGQVAQLKQMFKNLKLNLSVLVLQGAGVRAGYPDSDYIRAGAEIITKEELPHHDGPPDVVHALKEPSAYESTIPSPFCRLGALHTRDFSKTSGLAELLKARNVTILDGASIGCPAKRRIPVRGAMSFYAGDIGAEWILDHVGRRRISGTAVVVGAGYVGRSAVNRLMKSPEITKVYVFESAADPKRVAEVKAKLGDSPKIQFETISGIDDEKLLTALAANCVGVLFATFNGTGDAPKVVSLSELTSRTHEECMIVDVSVDEGGAIADPGLKEGWTSKEIIPYLTEQIGQAGGRVYKSQPNMPRSRPHETSEAHGEVMLPYIATLLYHSAIHGGAEGVTRHLLEKKHQTANPDPAGEKVPSVFDALTQDLRNGLAFCPQDGVIRIDETASSSEEVQLFMRYWGIPFKVGLTGTSEERRDSEIVEMFRKLPEGLKKRVAAVL